MSECADEDYHWCRRVVLELVPHPELERKEPVQCDYPFDKNGVMLVRFAPLSLATLLDNGALTARSITLDQFGSSSSGLRNREALYGVPSLKLAPRYVL